MPLKYCRLVYTFLSESFEVECSQIGNLDPHPLERKKFTVRVLVISWYHRIELTLTRLIQKHDEPGLFEVVVAGSSFTIHN